MMWSIARNCVLRLSLLAVIPALAQTQNGHPSFCLVVKTGNSRIDRVVFDQIRSKLSACLRIENTGNLPDMGVIEVLVTEKGLPLPEPWLKDGKMAQGWYNEWKGTLPPGNADQEKPKYPSQILDRSPQIHKIRVRLPGNTASIETEATVINNEGGMNRFGTEAALSGLKIQIRILAESFLRAHPELCGSKK